ncbi:NAD(P)H-flavin reductase [Vibrio sp. SM6]|uniref:NAD(P)H-flavin reductase n=1 Tax=Vibrio agarilyticus TaxID=2726741 RepID=A0A7X8YIN5_9VIBR|nr:NAD(P)H-flavin reductase [Vibrio agarilyticus]NLS14771.1 NAD(P)H-flavin reductase [Vibrio agarilyticus]
MTTKCRVKTITPLASNTFQVILQPLTPIEFEAGQYLFVVMGANDKRPFSIANSPYSQGGELELHIGAAEHNRYALDVVDLMRDAQATNSEIDIDAPHGSATISLNSDRPMLLIAGGTGFSYVRSILDYCIAHNKPNPIYLYWGAKQEEQLYALSELRQLEKDQNHFHFIPVVELSAKEWKGKVGNVLQAIETDFESLEHFDIYIAGRFEMAGAARDIFTRHKHAKKERMFADAYSFI